MSASLYTKQNQELIFNTQSNLSAARTITIKSTSPTGLEKDFTPSTVDYDTVHYKTLTTDFTEKGLHDFYIDVIYNDGTRNRSESVKIMFN